MTIKELISELETASRQRDADMMKALISTMEGFDHEEAPAWTGFYKAQLYRLGGDFHSALEQFQSARSHFKDLNKPSEAARSLGFTGIIYNRLGDKQAAIDSFKEAKTFYEAGNDQLSVAKCLSNMANVYRLMGNYEESLQLYGSASTAFEQAGDRRSKAMCMQETGGIYENMGEFDVALEYIERTAAIFEELDDQIGLAQHAHHLGNIHFKTANYPSAQSYYLKAKDLYEGAGDIGSAAVCMANIGSVQLASKDLPAALDSFEQAKELALKVNYKDCLALSLYSMGVVRQKLNQFEEARELLLEAHALYRSFNHSGDEAKCLDLIAQGYLIDKDADQALEMLQKAESLDVKQPEIIISLILTKAGIKMARGEFDSAETALQEALQMGMNHDLRHNQAAVHLKLRELAKKQEDFTAYVTHNEAHAALEEEIRGADKQRFLAVQQKDRELEEQKRQQEAERKVLYATLPKSVANRIINGEKVSDHYPSASVLFLDIVGFTKLSSTISADQLVDILDELFGMFDDICTKNEVTRIKTIGDAYMAVCGVPHEVDDHQEKLYRAAMEMMQSVNESKSDKIRTLGLRIGLHNGPLTAGVIGKERFQYDIWGDTVNIASRMESTAEPGMIQCSEEFINKLPSEPASMQSRKVEVKGKGEMTTFFYKFVR